MGHTLVGWVVLAGAGAIVFACSPRRQAQTRGLARRRRIEGADRV
jgi:hypothetical protein